MKQVKKVTVKEFDGVEKQMPKGWYVRLTPGCWFGPFDSFEAACLHASEFRSKQARAA